MKKKYFEGEGIELSTLTRTLLKRARYPMRYERAVLSIFKGRLYLMCTAARAYMNIRRGCWLRSRTG